MRKLFVMAVRDRGIDTFGTPIFVQSVREGVRMFSDAVRDDKTAFNKHPDDYDLYLFGTFVDGPGEFQTGVPRMVAIGKDQLNGPVMSNDEFGGM